MKRNLLLALFLFISLVIHAQSPEVRSAAYYREHPFPSVREVKQALSAKLGYYVISEAYFSLVKKPDGYYLYLIKYDGTVQGRYLCWSAEQNRYVDIPLKTRSYPIETTLYASEPTLDNNLFFGYSRWYEDVMKAYANEKELNCDEAQYLARAYDMKASNILFNNLGDNEYLDPLYAKSRSEAELQEVVKWRWEAIKMFEKSAQLCPDKNRVVGSAVFKSQCICMAFYYDLMILGYTKYANQFLEKANFDLFYVNVGKNLLNQCAQNGVLFVGGDADTYVCIYVQEKLGFRKDVKVMNTSLLQTGWYISYFISERKIKTIQPLSFYCAEISSIAYLTKSGGAGDFNEVCNDVNLGKPNVITQVGEKSYIALSFTSIKVGAYSMDMANGTYMSRYELFLADLLTSNPELPVYYSSTVTSTDYKFISKYKILEGVVSKIDVNAENYTSGVNLPVFKQNMFDGLIWNDISTSKLLEDEKSKFTLYYRECFYLYMDACVKTKNDKDAVQAAEKIFSLIPDEIVPYDHYVARAIAYYYPIAQFYPIGNFYTAKKVVNLCAKRVDESYARYKSIPECANSECTEELRYEFYSTYVMAESLSHIQNYERAKEMDKVVEDFRTGLLKEWDK